MKRRKSHLTIKPPQLFKPGQRIRVSPAGTEYGLIPPGTTGTVDTCTFLIEVEVDGVIRSYAPDYWEPEK